MSFINNGIFDNIKTEFLIIAIAIASIIIISIFILIICLRRKRKKKLKIHAQARNKIEEMQIQARNDIIKKKNETDRRVEIIIKNASIKADVIVINAKDKAAKIIRDAKLESDNIIKAADSAVASAEKKLNKLKAEYDEINKMLKNATNVKYNQSVTNTKASINVREQMIIHKIENTFNKIDFITGEQFEKYIMEILSDMGFVNITQTAKTGDYGVDILALKNNYKYAFQCKRYSTSIGTTAIQEIVTGKQFYDCDYAIVVTNNQFTRNAKILAEKCNVILWDRNSLIDSLKDIYMQTELI